MTYKEACDHLNIATNDATIQVNEEHWISYDGPGEDICLDGYFTVLTLEAIIVWLRYRKEQETQK